MFLKAVQEVHYHDDNDDDIKSMMMTMTMKSTVMKMLQPVQQDSLICVPYLQAVVKWGGDQLVCAWVKLFPKTRIWFFKKWKRTWDPLNASDVAKMLVQGVQQRSFLVPKIPDLSKSQVLGSFSSLVRTTFISESTEQEAKMRSDRGFTLRNNMRHLNILNT